MLQVRPHLPFFNTTLEKSHLADRWTTPCAQPTTDTGGPTPTQGPSSVIHLTLPGQVSRPSSPPRSNSAPSTAFELLSRGKGKDRDRTRSVFAFLPYHFLNRSSDLGWDLSLRIKQEGEGQEVAPRAQVDVGKERVCVRRVRSSAQAVCQSPPAQRVHSLLTLFPTQNPLSHRVPSPSKQVAARRGKL